MVSGRTPSVASISALLVRELHTLQATVVVASISALLVRELHTLQATVGTDRGQ
jgi:hypothetical protein